MKTIINLNNKVANKTIIKNRIKKDKFFTIEGRKPKEAKICKYCGEHGCYCSK